MQVADASKSHVLIDKLPYVAAIHSDWGKRLLWRLETKVQPHVGSDILSRNSAMAMDYEFTRIPATTHSQVIQEYFIPRAKYLDFVKKMRGLIDQHDVNLVYSSTRAVKADVDTALSYAKEDCLSVVICRDQKTTPEDKARMDVFARAAAEAALECGGSFYLCYQLPFTNEQMRRAYPELDAFFETKRRFDPDGLFMNSLFDQYARAANAPKVRKVVNAKPPFKNIENVVVLCLENRSFGHMVGLQAQRNPEIRGFRGDESVPVDLNDPSKGVVRVRPGAAYIGDINPGHEPENVAVQLYGRSDPDWNEKPSMKGFVKDYLALQPKGLSDAERLEGAEKIMAAFTPEQLPVLTKLIDEFVLCDASFSSVPTSTFPNRVFMQAGTSMGHLHSSGKITDPELRDAMFGSMYAGRTIYDLLSAAKKSWKNYRHDIAWSLMIPSVRKDARNLARFDQFKKDVAAGELPSFSFIEPAYINTSKHKASDMDAPHDVREGERLIAEVYNTLRANPDVWNKTLLVVTFDEHGGYYDNAPPPKTVSPDGLASRDPSFGFDRLGVRVPTILISPWLPKGKVDHTVYDHASILSFTERLFDLPPLTERDARANSFEGQFLKKPRADAPERIEPPAPGPEKCTDRALYDPSEPSPRVADAAVRIFDSAVWMLATSQKVARATQAAIAGATGFGRMLGDLRSITRG
jgi:phospholipase C